MARQKTGKPLGRPPLYSEDEKPLTVSLRVPRDLAEQTKRYAALRRQSVTELLLDGLRWRIGEGDPRGGGMAFPQQPAYDKEYYGNTETSHDALTDTAGTAVLEEIRTMLVSQGTELHKIAQALTQRSSVPDDNQYLSNTITEDTQTDNGTDTVVPAYDPTRYQLGALCKRAHVYGDTGQSLREIRQGKVAECAACHRERGRAANAKRPAKQGAGQ